MAVLSVQSHVVLGHVGNAAAVFALQRLGCEVWPLNTVQFSNNTAYPRVEGEVFTAEVLQRTFEGLAANTDLADCRAVLTGYLGSAALGAVVLEAVAAVKAANPAALWLCDPVMGTTGKGLFVKEEVAAFFSGPVIAQSDILAPNLFELSRLSGLEAHDADSAVVAARRLIAQGPPVVLITSVPSDHRHARGTGALAVTAEKAWQVATPLIDFELAVGGTGDLFTALFLARHLAGQPLPECLSLAVSALYAVLQETQRQGRREMALVAAQEALVEPPDIFPPVLIA